MPLVSIIVPIYNCEKYLRQCLNSILSQTVCDYEVILVNDGSKDSSGEICDEYAQLDSRFKVVHKSNEGLSAARNDGIELARGEWITFIDSDDWIEPCFLDILDANLTVDYIITSINHHKVDCEIVAERFKSHNYVTLDANVFAIENLKQAFFTAWSKFFNTKIICDNKLRFLQGVSPGEDTIFVFQYLCHVKSLYLSDVPCYNWRVANGLTNRKRSFDWIIYTIEQTMSAIEQVESICDVELAFIKYNSLNYLIDKVDVRQYSYRQLYSEIKKLASKSWMINIVKDHQYMKKGRWRKLIDFLMLNKAFFITSVLCKRQNRLY